MRLLPLLALAAIGYCATSWVAGYTSLTAYAVSGGAGLWQNMIDKCQEFEDGGGVVKGIDCVGNAVFYCMGAAAAFGAGQVGAMYIQSQGVTTQGKRNTHSFRNSTRSWNWDVIHADPAPLHNALANGLPGLVVGHVYNHSDSNLHNSVTVFVQTPGAFFAHSSNVTHGSIAWMPQAANSSDPSKRSNLHDRGYYWNFGSYAGFKFSYQAPGCAPYSFSSQPETGNLRSLVHNFVYWAQNGNQGSTYDLEWDDENEYGTPYVGGSFIIESNPFGYGFEGTAQNLECIGAGGPPVFGPN